MIALLATARAIHFASLMAIFGASAYASLLQRAGLWELPRKATRLYFATAAMLAIVSGIIWLCLIAGQMSGSWQDSLDPVTVELAATSTRFGQIFLARFLGLAALWLMCAFRIRSDTIAVSILASLLLASLGPVSHPAGSSGGEIVSVGAISDAAHLLTGGFWIGGLLVLATFLQRYRADRAALLEALRLFSIWGTIAVGVLIITGLFNAISVLPFSEMSLRNSYFDWLAAKAGLASLMIGLASLNRWRFAPALRTGGERVTPYLAASISSEIVLGLGVVAVAAALGLMPPH